MQERPGVVAGADGALGVDAAAQAAGGLLVGVHCAVGGPVCQTPGWLHEDHTWL